MARIMSPRKLVRARPSVLGVKGGLRMIEHTVGRVNQAGIVLVTVLIVLVAMLIGALTMMRASDTAILISGNMAFKQNTVSSADLAIESAASWISSQSNASLQSNHASSGYLASYDQTGPDILHGQNWDGYWNDVARLPTGVKCWISWSGNPAVASCRSSDSESDTTRYDAAGNRSAYVIQRMCLTTGDPMNAATGCEMSVSTDPTSTGSKGAGKVTLTTTSQVYYRITARVMGPRNTITYTQAIVAF